MQKYMSEKYASLILNFQSNMGWLQVAQGWQQMAQIESTARSSFDSEDEVYSAPSESIEQYDKIEQSSERALLSVVKIMYIQAGKKLSIAQESHYQTKMQLAMLQGYAAAAPQIGSVVSLMYYLQILRVMSSAYTLQRQDAWNTWLVYEMIETDIFGNVQENIPESFLSVMATAQVNAMTAYHHEASTDLQIMFLEQYLQMLVAQFSGSHANAASSFLEEEVTETPAEPSNPSKPFFPFMGMGMNPQIMTYYTMMMKYWSVMFNYQASQGLLTNAVMELKELTDGTENTQGAQVKTYAVSSLQQWAYLNMMQTMFEFQSVMAMMSYGGSNFAHADAAAANSFVQTEAAAPEQVPAAAPTATVTEEQKTLLNSVVNQFLRPQPIISQPAAQ